MAKAAAKKATEAEESDEAAEGEGEDKGEGKGEAQKRKRFTPKKLAIFVGVPILLLGGAYQFGVLDMLLGGGGEKAAEEKEATPKEAVYVELPDMLVNLRSIGKQPSYLKLSVSLELDDPLIVPDVEKVKPRIIDRFQVYLRELRAEDISGSAGVYRLKEELLARINAAIAPHEVKDVLFREMLIQ